MDDKNIVTDTDVKGLSGAEVSYKLYPNPTHSTFTVELHSPMHDASPVSIYILSMRGEVIEQRTVEAGQPAVFSLEGHQPGVYLVRILFADQIFVERLIKR